jgi:hypothetical protein
MNAFLHALPTAATSPYAFAAYVVLVAAWVVTVWLRNQPYRKSLEIVKTFKDDRERNKSLAQLLGDSPPAHLKNDQILDWLKIKSSEKTRAYLLIGVVAVLITVTVIVVVAMTTARTPAAGSIGSPLKIRVRGAGNDGANCLPLPEGARIGVNAANAAPHFATINGCEAKLDWPVDWRVGQTAHVTVENAGGFVLDEPNTAYTLGNPDWEVVMRSAPKAPRLLVQVNNYPPEGPLFDQFYGIVSSKIRVLGDRIARDHPACDYMRDLRVEKTGRVDDRSANRTLLDWRSTNALLFLSGMFRRDGTTDYVRSTPFFGELASKDADLNSLQLELRIDVSELQQTTDSHSLAVLYALAMDARRLGRPNDVVLTFLGEAVSVAQSIDSSLPGVAALKAQLRKAIQDLGAPIPPVL